MAGQKPSREFSVAFGVLKTAAIAVGLLATTISLMAVVGSFTANGWARLIVSAVVAIGVPLVVIDRLLPENDPVRARGMPTDVLAVAWLGFALAFVGLGGRATGAMLVREADRERAAGLSTLASATYWLAGARPVDAPATAAGSGGTDATGNAASGGGGTAGARVASADAGAVAQAGADAGIGSATIASGDAGAAPRRAERTPAELFRDLAPSVVTVSVQGPRGEGGGTGFLLDADGTIATNHHVVDSAEQVHIKLFDNTRVDDVELLAEDPRVDLALLRIHTTARLSPVALGDSDAVMVGERAISIGNPLGLEHTLTDGLVSARRIWEGRPMIQMSVPVSPGNSGGPLFNMRGEVIGITTAQLGGPFARAQNLNLAVPVNVLRRMIRADYPNRRRYSNHGASIPNRW